MRQRSTHDAPVDVPAIPATVQPGEIVDWPHPIAGFEPVPDEPPADTKTSTRKRADKPATTDKEMTGDDRAL